MPSVYSKPLLPEVVYCGVLKNPPKPWSSSSSSSEPAPTKPTAPQGEANVGHPDEPCQKPMAPPGEANYGNREYEQLAAELAYMLRNTDAHKAVPGTFEKHWKPIKNQAFYGMTIAATNEFIPGCMAGMREWKGNRSVDKFRIMTIRMMGHYQAVYIAKGGRDVTELEQLAFDLMNEREVALKDAAKKIEAKKMKKKKRDQTNQNEESDMGLRMTKKVPTGSHRPSDALGKKTTSCGVNEDWCNDFFSKSYSFFTDIHAHTIISSYPAVVLLTIFP